VPDAVHELGISWLIRAIVERYLAGDFGFEAFVSKGIR
jgi:hypothetical protein